MPSPDIDTILHSHSPAVMVPRYRPVEAPLQCSGHRYLVAEDGLYLHVFRPWLECITRIAPSAIKLPFGVVRENVRLRLPQIPKEFLQRFVEGARVALPNEQVALVTWNANSGEFRYVEPEVVSRSPAHVEYERPQLARDEWLVLDMHSHGYEAAFFSRDVDDVDDANEVKISLVAGKLGEARPHIVTRLCAQGAYLPLPLTLGGGAAGTSQGAGDVGVSESSQWTHAATASAPALPVKLRLEQRLLERQIEVAVIGAGGTGSQAIYGLAQLDMAMRALGHPDGLAVTVIDDDVVSEANIGRQLFLPCDVGLHKATVLVHRINLTFGTHWTAMPVRLGVSRLDAQPDIVLGCVDNRPARKVMAHWFAQGGRGGRYWLDFGNNVSSGQVIMGHSRDGKIIVPSVAQLMPEIVDVRLKDADEGPSCSLAEALQKQSLFINRTLATHGLNILWELFRHGEVDHHGVFVNMKNGRVTPMQVDASAWARLGYGRKRH